MLGKIDSPLNQKLAQVKWGEFKISKLFNIENTLSFNADKLVNGSEYDYVTRTSLNQGILKTTGFVNERNLNDSGNWSLGLLQMDFFYRRNPWYAGQFVRKISPKFAVTDNTALFFTTILNGLKKDLLSVLVRNVDNIFLNSTIQLPINGNGEIDFGFIDGFVAELEGQRVAELEGQRVAELQAYLSATGLNDYTLTTKELKALEDFNNCKWKFFNLESLFGKATRGKRLKGDDRIDGALPFVTAGEANEGISAFIGNNVHIFSKNTTTIDMFGSAKYRNYSYGGDDHIAVVHTEKLQQNAAIFVTSAIHKSSHNGQFNYGHNFYAKDADELNILLPARSTVPDYDLMETLISAVKKLVIKDVVNYADKKIALTKEVISKS